LVAVAVGIELGIPFDSIAAALQSFRGVHRRFEIHGAPGDIMVVDDYAHYPNEIRATLKAAKEGWNRKIIAVFQPQRFTRTQLLMDEFARAFDNADEVVIADIYYEGTGEEPIPGVTSERLAELIRGERRMNGCSVRHIGAVEDIVEYLAEHSIAGDLIITMGAGDIWKVAQDLVDRIEVPISGER
jgi:UDP-N-acetylmuramate--alanine ligase